MKQQIEQLERDVERQMGLLDELSATTPGAEFLARVKAAVTTEAARLGGPPARSRGLPRWAAVAAAVLLAVGLSGVFTQSLAPGEQPVDAAELLAIWVDAVADSSDRLTFLLDEAWLLEAAGGDNGEALEGFLDSLETSFEQFEAL